MERDKVVHVISILLVLLLATTLYIAPENTGSSSYEDIGIGEKEPIPENLPWYYIAVFGDNRPNNSGEVEYNPIFYRIVDEIDFINPYAVLGTGDHVWNGFIDQIQHFIETVSKLPNVWVVAGNHEWNNKPYIDDSNREGVMYWRQHVAPDLYYKDDFPGWRIVFINLRAGYPVEENWPSVKEWLVDNAFNTNRKLIVVFHEPLHPEREASKAISKVQDKLEPLLNQYKPKIVFQGHIHCYGRGTYNGIDYIITGGGGAPKCKRYPYHFVITRFKSNGVYSVIPVDAETLSYDIDASSTSSTYTVTIHVYKAVDVDGYRIHPPYRVSIKIGDTVYTVVTHLYKGLNKIRIVDLGDTIKLTIKAYHDSYYKTYIYSSEGDLWIVNETGYKETVIYINGVETTTTTTQPVETTITTTPSTTITTRSSIQSSTSQTLQPTTSIESTTTMESSYTGTHTLESKTTANGLNTNVMSSTSEHSSQYKSTPSSIESYSSQNNLETTPSSNGNSLDPLIVADAVLIVVAIIVFYLWKKAIV